MTKTEELQELMRRAADLIGEHCDGVLILVTWREDGRTKMIDAGNGNCFTLIGLATEYLDRSKSITLANELQLPPAKPDEGDDWKGSPQ